MESFDRNFRALEAITKNYEALRPKSFEIEATLIFIASHGLVHEAGEILEEYKNPESNMLAKRMSDVLGNKLGANEKFRSIAKEWQEMELNKADDRDIIEKMIENTAENLHKLSNNIRKNFVREDTNLQVANLRDYKNKADILDPRDPKGKSIGISSDGQVFVGGNKGYVHHSRPTSQTTPKAERILRKGGEAYRTAKKPDDCTVIIPKVIYQKEDKND